MDALPLAQFAGRLANAARRTELAGDGRGGTMVFQLDGRSHGPVDVGALPLVLIGIGHRDDPAAGVADVVVPDTASAEVLLDAVERNPVAATALALLLRGTGARGVADGLVAESSTYSTLQSGPEHGAWRASRRSRSPRGRHDRDPVLVRRLGDELRVTLQRGEVRNAFDTAMRDAFLEALDIAAYDPDHSHWAEVHDDGWPAARPEDGIPAWKEAPPIVAAEKSTVRAGDPS